MIWNKPTVEVPIVLYAFGGVLVGSVYTNLIIYRTCYTILGYNETDCALLGNVDNNVTQHLEALVEPEANIIGMTKSVVESIFTLTLLLFVGPWSDKFGRKPIMVISAIGSSISAILMVFYCFFANLSPWYTMLCAIPSVVTGGWTAHFSVVMSYITDTTIDANRGVRMATIEALLAIVNLIGNTVSSYIFYATSYTFVFAISACCSLLGLFYTIFFIPESVENIQQEGKVRGFFKLSNIKEMLDVTLKPRDDYAREILLLMTIFSVFSALAAGDGGITFLYFREKFGWTLTKFTLYNSVMSIISFLSTVIGTLLLHKYLAVTESVLILMGLISSLDGHLMLGLATRNWHIYAAGALRYCVSFMNPMRSSLLSKLIPVNEMGKIFSITMFITFIFGLASGPLYTVIYNNTIKTDATIYNFLTAGLHGASIIIVLIIMSLEFLVFRRHCSLSEDRTESTHNLIENELLINTD